MINLATIVSLHLDAAEVRKLGHCEMFELLDVALAAETKAWEMVTLILRDRPCMW